MYTPTPWRYDKESKDGRWLIVGPDSYIVFALDCATSNPNSLVMDDNANHIVACVNAMADNNPFNATPAQLTKRIANARAVLLDMIDGADDGDRGRDSELSRAIRILDGATGIFA